MALSIKNTRTEELARELAEATGESVTRAVTVAVEERLARFGFRHRRDVERRRTEELLAALWDLPDLDTRSPDEILDYDERGLP